MLYLIFGIFENSQRCLLLSMHKMNCNLSLGRSAAGRELLVDMGGGQRDRRPLRRGSGARSARVLPHERRSSEGADETVQWQIRRAAVRPIRDR